MPLRIYAFLIVPLIGEDKSSQQRDVVKIKKINQKYE